MLELALTLGVNPAEIDTEWDEYWINRLLQLIEARALARNLR